MTDLQIIHTEPCSECPWRKIAAAGWLGGNEVETYSVPVRRGYLIPCHLRSHDAYCAGSAIAMRNSATLPRDPDMAREVLKVTKSDDVFRFASDFEKHHKT